MSSEPELHGRDEDDALDEFADDADRPSGWSDEEAELDQLYRQAMEAVEAIEVEMQRPWDGGSGEREEDVEDVTLPEPALADESSEEESGGSDGSPASIPFPGAGQEAATRPSLRQVVEAALFVGGQPLTGKMLIHLLQNEFTASQIDDALDSLNRQYAEECRPYEIRLVEGGWQMQLRAEFEKVRHKTYGLGPKEVKLSQDALEVLALVAYHQPLTSEAIEGFGGKSPNTVLRQLLRRELISIERGEGGRKDIRYRTTDRFLQLFDLRGLDDLPRAEEIAFK